MCEQTLILGQMPEQANPLHYLAAGPWCFSGQQADLLFPNWEKNFIFAPEPLLNLQNLETTIKQAQDLCVEIVPLLAKTLSTKDLHLPPSYWETLLTPFVLDLTTQIVERRQRVQAMLKEWGELALSVPVLPVNCTFDFATEQAFRLYGALGTDFNHWLFSVLLEAVWPQKWQKVLLPAIHARYGYERKRVSSLLKNYLRRLQLYLPFPRLKGLSWGQALRFSLALLHKSHGTDHSLALTEYYSGAKHAQAHNLPCDLLPIFLTCLPATLKQLRHPQTIKQSSTPRLRIASVLAYEDAPYRQKLAIWRAQGHRLGYVQHGGNYGQTLFAGDKALIEYSQHIFITWGWHQHGTDRGNFLALPYPQLARIADQWHGRQSSDLLFVGTEMPLYGYRLDAHPVPTQIVAYRQAKKRFFHALGSDLQKSSFYRPYFELPCGTLTDAPYVLSNFPALRQSKGALTPQLLECRLLVLDHHGTTLLEAMVANVPMLLYWQKEAWPLTPLGEAHLNMLEQAGIWCATPEQAAKRVQEVWSNPSAWWQETKVQNARRSFCSLYARTVFGNENRYWLQVLKNL